MTAFALNTAHRFANFFGALIDVLAKAVAMNKAVHHNRPTAADMKIVRAIAATI